MTPAAATLDPTVRELLDRRLCTLTCLSAAEAGRCGCRCRGRWHGWLSAADVDPDIWATSTVEAS